MSRTPLREEALFADALAQPPAQRTTFFDDATYSLGMPHSPAAKAE